MITPDKILGYNKVRDAQICMLFLYENNNQQQIADKLSISRTRVGQVLYVNRALLVSESLDSEYEKLQRVQYYRKKMEEAPDTLHDKEYWSDRIKAELEESKTESVQHNGTLNRLLGLNN